MALIIRIDVDRPYGRSPLPRHLLSRMSSDLYFPTVESFGYLSELDTILGWLNEANARSYVFFRKCTLPTRSTLDLLVQGRHEIGLHLENSRSLETFRQESNSLARHVGKTITAVSKHGSGGKKFGLRHYAPYEPDKYLAWAQSSSMRVFLGNLEDPTVPAMVTQSGLIFFPSAFWLEPSWRDTSKFHVDWLLDYGARNDVVLLLHPENVLANPELIHSFKAIIKTLKSTILQ